MAKKVKRTRKKKTPRNAAQEPTLSVDLDEDEPEIVVHEPEIDLGTPQEVPADHLVDDRGVTIDLGPSHVAPQDADAVIATAPAVRGPGVNRIAQQQRMRLWITLGGGVVALVAGAFFFSMLPSSAGPLTTTATVEGQILLTDATGVHNLTERTGRIVIPAGSEIEARGSDVAALHFSSGWTLWMKPGTRLLATKVSPDLDVNLISGSLGGDGASEGSMLIVRTSLATLNGLPRSRFAVMIGPQVRAVVARGNVITYDKDSKPLSLGADEQMAWGKGAATRPATVEADQSTGWMSQFPQVRWVTVDRNEFDTYTAGDHEGDVGRFAVKRNTDGLPMLTNTDVTKDVDKLIMQWPLDGDVRVTTRFRPQKVDHRKAAVGLIFGYKSSQEYYAVLYSAQPVPKLTLVHRASAPEPSIPFALADDKPLSSILWYTLTVEVVGKTASFTLDDHVLGVVELEQYTDGQTGIIAERALAQWQLFLLKEPGKSAGE